MSYQRNILSSITLSSGSSILSSSHQNINKAKQDALSIQKRYSLFFRCFGELLDPSSQTESKENVIITPDIEPVRATIQEHKQNNNDSVQTGFMFCPQSNLYDFGFKYEPANSIQTFQTLYSQGLLDPQIYEEIMKNKFDVKPRNNKL